MARADDDVQAKERYNQDDYDALQEVLFLH
jgi:hypothetical protein